MFFSPATLAIIAIEGLAIAAFVDVLGGVFHWAMDTFGTPDTPIWGPWFVRANERHHSTDGVTAFLEHHWSSSSIDMLAAAPVVIGFAWWFGALSWQVWWFLLLSFASPHVHRFAHMPTARVPGIVRFLQHIHVVQGPAHHWRHHAGQQNTHYCALTPWANPLLDAVGFFRGLERLLVPVFGAPRRTDLVEKPWYPTTA